MPSLITKWKKGKPYLYWVRTARVNGQSRIVEQHYLGPRQRVIQQIYEGFTTRSVVPPPVPPTCTPMPELKRLQIKEFGASAVFYTLTQALGLVEVIDSIVPLPPPGRRTQLSVGQYLVLAALNRAIAPHSKRAFADWYATTVLSRLVEAAPEELTSQRFWDAMQQVTPTHIQHLQRALVTRLAQHYPLDRQVLIYDTTNYYTFLSTFNTRAHLPQRGRNKQRRGDLRQVSVAVVLEEASGLPVYHRCYEGNLTDVQALQPLLKELDAVVGPSVPASASDAPGRRTLILDKGNISEANLQALTSAGFSFIAAIPETWTSPFSTLSLAAYQPLTVGERRRVKVAEHCQPVWETALAIQGKALSVFSPSFYRQQVRTLDLLQHRADRKLQHLAASLVTHRRREPAVRREIAALVAHDRLSSFFSYRLTLEHGHVVGLHWQWDHRQKVALKHQSFGRTTLYTDRPDLGAQRIVELYRRQAQIEALFRISKSRRPGLWWPAYHWTDAKLRVHAFTCFLALLLLQIVLKRLQEHQIAIGIEHLMEQLRGIQEALVIYANGTSQRVLAERTPQQEELCDALNIYALAQQRGNTVPDR